MCLCLRVCCMRPGRLQPALVVVHRLSACTAAPQARRTCRPAPPSPLPAPRCHSEPGRRRASGLPAATYRLRRLTQQLRSFHPAAAGLGGGVPQDYLLRNTTKNGDPMLAFSDRGGELSAWLGRLWLGRGRQCGAALGAGRAAAA